MLKLLLREKRDEGGNIWVTSLGLLSAYPLLGQGYGPNPSISQGLTDSNSVLALDQLWTSNIAGKAQPGSVQVFVQTDGTIVILMILSAAINSTHLTLAGPLQRVQK